MFFKDKMLSRLKTPYVTADGAFDFEAFAYQKDLQDVLELIRQKASLSVQQARNGDLVELSDNIGFLFGRFVLYAIAPQTVEGFNGKFPAGSFFACLESLWDGYGLTPEDVERLKKDNPNIEKLAASAVIEGACDELKRIFSKWAENGADLLLLDGDKEEVQPNE